jgi:hypothetical protein
MRFLCTYVLRQKCYWIADSTDTKLFEIQNKMFDIPFSFHQIDKHMRFVVFSEYPRRYRSWFPVLERRIVL